MAFDRRSKPVLTNAVASLVTVAVALGVAASVSATELDSPPPSTTAHASPTSEELEERRTLAETDTTLTEDQRATVLILYDRAIRSTREAARVSTELQALRDLVDSAPQRIAELEARLETMDEPPMEFPESFVALSDEVLRARVEAARLELLAALDEFRKFRILSRQLSIAPLRAAVETGERLEAAKAEVLAESVLEFGAAHESIAVANQSLLQAQAIEQRAHRDLARERSAQYGLISRLRFVETTYAFHRAQQLTDRHDALARAIEARRASQAREETKNAEVAVAAMSQMPAEMRQLASENLALRTETEETLREEAEAARLRRSRRLGAIVLEGDVRFAEQRLRWAGANAAVGQLIRDRLRDMPSILEIEQGAAARGAARTRAVERRIELEREYRILANPEEVVATIIDSMPGKIRAELGESWLRDETLQLVRARRASTEALYTVNGRYLWVLARLDNIEDRIALVVQTGLDLRRQDLLWIRNLPAISLADGRTIRQAWHLVTAPSQWRAAGRSALESFRVRPWSCLVLFTLLIVLVALRSRCRRRLTELAEHVRRVRTDAFGHTVQAALCTVAMAGVVPLALVTVGWLARSEPWTGDFSAAVGEALIAAGLTLFAFTVLRWACRPEGLSRHFRWPEAVRKGLKRELLWFSPVLVVARALDVFANRAGSEVATLVIGRPAIIVTALAFAVFVWRFFGPKSALTEYFRSLTAIAYIGRWRGLWYPIIQVIPILLALSSALGYHYAASQLTRVLAETMWLVIGLLLLRDILLRWFYVAERRLRLEAALRQREELRASRERGEDEPEGQGEVAEVEVEEIDYRQLGEEGRAGIKIGVAVGALLSLWALWADLLPAVGALDRFELPLTHAVVIDGIERQVPITLSDLALLLFVLGGVFFAAKNLRGLFGFVLLQRLRLDPGASYAIITLCQYLLVAGGLIYAFSAIGVQWSKLQWLVAALGVGLGFGLQEIVANFVSGIILLLERPVRVGDIVTVGDTDGTVARIRIRATTIVTFEKKELVVPNKEFITTRVLNWSLSDAELRLLVIVGIAYGSDARKARELILEAAGEAEHVLNDPAPTVTFSSFGDNALNLELRCYLPDMDHWLSTKTTIHDAIYEKLNDAGIVISFPQRDVHLDVAGPVDVRVQPQS